MQTIRLKPTALFQFFLLSQFSIEDLASCAETAAEKYFKQQVDGASIEVLHS